MIGSWLGLIGTAAQHDAVDVRTTIPPSHFRNALTVFSAIETFDLSVLR